MVCVASVRAPAALPERDADGPVSYKFDRRHAPRRTAGVPAWIPATFADGEGRFGVTGVQVIGDGPTGLGLRSNCEIEPGMTISLHPRGCRFPTLTATVVRCMPDDDGYVIGLSALPCRAA